MIKPSQVILLKLLWLVASIVPILKRAKEKIIKKQNDNQNGSEIIYY